MCLLLTLVEYILLTKKVGDFMQGLEKIRKFRKKRGLTLMNVSEVTKLSPGYIADLEKNKKTNPTMDTLTKLANALGVKVSDLVE